MNFDYPLPKLYVDISTLKLNVPIDTQIEGSLHLKNTSYGTLSARVTTDIPNFRFIQDIICENECDIKYIYNPKYHNIGDIITGRIIIESTGGEAVIKTTITIVKKEIKLNELKINDLKSFTRYAQTNFFEAQKLFNSSDFLKVCNIEDSSIIKLYRRLNMDIYKDTALDNFLIVTNQKEHAVIKLVKPKIVLKLKCFEDKKIRCKLPIKVIGFGALEYIATSQSNAAWIEFSEAAIRKMYAKDGEMLEFSFIINPNLIEAQVARDLIEFKSPYHSEILELEIKKEAEFKAELSKLDYDMIDNGTIKITNNVGEDIVVEIGTYDKWIKFKSKKYFISAVAEIPFEINLIKSFDFSKIPIYSTTIMVKALIRKKVVKKYLTLKVINSKFKIDFI